MITSIHILNFQSHRDTTVHFHKGVNAITGLSDSGKTVILRALNWVITNKPAGESFRSNWGGDTEVQLVLENGTTVIRRRTDTENSYTIVSPDPAIKPQVFKAFGQGAPPAEIQAVLNINDINMSYQQESPFLLSSGPGEVAQILNKVVNLDIIDTAVSNVRKKSLEVSRKLKSAEERKISSENNLSKFDNIDNMETRVAELEQLQLSAVHAGERKDTVTNLITRICQQKRALEKPLTLLNARQDIDGCLEMAEKAGKLKTRAVSIQSVLDHIERLKGQLAYKIIEASPKVATALEDVRKIAPLKLRLGLLKELITNIKHHETLVLERGDWIEYEENKLVALMPETCPLCGRGD